MNAKPPIRWPRRALFGAAGLAALLPGPWPRHAGACGEAAAAEIVQPARPDPRAFIERSFELRRTTFQDLENAALRVGRRDAIAASRRLDDAQASPAPPLLKLACLRPMQPMTNTRTGSSGALVVKGDRIVGQAPSRVVLERDPTARAEMAAIRDTARRLGRRDLSGCRLYSSSRPCPMCKAAAYWAGIERLSFGRAMTDGGAPRLCR